MKKNIYYALAAGFCITSSSFAALVSHKATDTEFSPTQTKQVETVVKNYLINNPSVIVEAVQGMQKKRRAKIC